MAPSSSIRCVSGTGRNRRSRKRQAQRLRALRESLRDRPESPVTETNLLLFTHSLARSPGQAGIAGHGNIDHGSNTISDAAPGQAGIAGHGNVCRVVGSRAAAILRDRPESPVTETFLPCLGDLFPTAPGQAGIAGHGNKYIAFGIPNDDLRDRPESPVTETVLLTLNWVTRTPGQAGIAGHGNFTAARPSADWPNLRDRPESPVTET